jgi:hypothetical protein
MEGNRDRERRRVHVRRRRIGVDLDYPRRLTLLRVYFNARHYFPDTKIDVNQTGKGHHFRIWQQNNVRQNLDVRRNLCDDPGRLRFDELRIANPELHFMIDTIFSRKWRNGKLLSEEAPCNILSEAFITRIPSRKP